jgi:hypothetical protein
MTRTAVFLAGLMLLASLTPLRAAEIPVAGKAI